MCTDGKLSANEQISVSIYSFDESDGPTVVLDGGDGTERVSRYLHMSRLEVYGVDPSCLSFDFRVTTFPRSIPGSVFYQIIRGQSPNGILLFIFPKNEPRERLSAMASALRDIDLVSAWAICLPRPVSKKQCCSGCTLQRRCGIDTVDLRIGQCLASIYHSLMPEYDLRTQILRRESMPFVGNSLPVGVCAEGE